MADQPAVPAQPTPQPTLAEAAASYTNAVNARTELQAKRDKLAAELKSLDEQLAGVAKSLDTAAGHLRTAK